MKHELPIFLAYLRHYRRTPQYAIYVVLGLKTQGLTCIRQVLYQLTYISSHLLYFLRQFSPSLDLQLTDLVTTAGQQVLETLPRTGIASVHLTAGIVMWVPEIRTQVLMLVWQAFYQLSYLSGSPKRSSDVIYSDHNGNTCSHFLQSAV